MPRHLPALALLLPAALAPAAHAIDLRPLETRWLQGIAPVVSHARQQLALPLDLIVQPQDAPDAAPIALGFTDGRCKLVLSLRGNAQAQRQLDSIEASLQGPLLELMAAHELGHCRRYLDGAWYSLPAGFAAAPTPPGLAPDLQRLWLDMRSTRREEGYGDLVGLAWIAERHPQHYARLHAWLQAERSAELIPGSHHDTLDWLALVKDPRALQRGSIFEAAATLWQQGLKEKD